MGFRKAEFFIIRANGEYKKVYGWADESGTYGFHALRRTAKKTGNQRVAYWIATDIASGLMITSGDTRQACMSWIVAHQKEINKQKKTAKYKEYVEKINNAFK